MMQRPGEVCRLKVSEASYSKGEYFKNAAAWQLGSMY
jgi:hypothetical protein